jgi:hypothetical protein
MARRDPNHDPSLLYTPPLKLEEETERERGREGERDSGSEGERGRLGERRDSWGESGREGGRERARVSE